MSVVAWDGKTLAADKRLMQGDLGTIGSKITKLDSGEILAWAGEAGGGLALVHWFVSGRRKEDWPDRQKTDDWTRLIVVDKTGVYSYEHEPLPQTVLAPFVAWGSGRDCALGAMAMGADAIVAVRVASQFIVSCGGGVEFFEIAQDKRSDS